MYLSFYSCANWFQAGFLHCIGDRWVSHFVCKHDNWNIHCHCLSWNYWHWISWGYVHLRLCYIYSPPLSTHDSRREIGW